MTSPWERRIRQLQRRVVVSSMVDAAAWVLLPAVPAAALYFIAERNIPWTRFFASYLAILLLAAICMAIVAGGLRGRKGELYCAKWIDITSRLEDRLASSVEWSRLPSLDAFQQRCIEQFSLEVGARRLQLILPSTRSSRLPLVAASGLVLVGLAAAHVYRPATDVDRDAHQKAIVSKIVLSAATKEADQVKAEAVRLQDVELNRISEDLKVFMDDVEQGRSDRETTLKAIDKLRSQIAAADRKTAGLGRLSETSLAGPVGALAAAIRRGDPKGTRAALEQVEAALEHSGLSDSEVADLKPLLEGLTSVTEHGSSLGDRLTQAVHSLESGDQPAAARSLIEARPQLSALDKPIAESAVLRRAEEALDQVHRTLEEGTAQQQATQTAAPSANELSGMGKSLMGAGEHTTTDRVADPLLPETANNVELSIKGVWNGKVMHSLFDGPNASDDNEAVKRILVDHERVVEDRFARDDIPLEYQDAIRVYFAAIHQKGK